MGSLNIAIVGTGGAGLAAAHKLIAAGHKVTLFEKNNYVGGRAATVKWHDFDLEIGASVLTSQDKPVLEYIKKFGLEIGNAPGGLNITVPRNGKLHTANFLNPFSLLAWKGISLKARLSILKLLPAIIGRMFELKGDPYHLEDGSHVGDNISFSDHFSRRINAELFEQCFYPMMETMMGYEQNDLSWKAFVSLMSVYMGGKSLAIKGGMKALTDKLAEGLDIKLEAYVSKVDVSPDKNSVSVTYTHKGNTESSKYDRAVIAVQGDKIAGLISDEDMRPAWNKMFNSIRYSSGAMQYLLLKTTFVPKVPMVYLPVTTGEPINQISFEAQNSNYLLAMTDPRIGSNWQKLSDNEMAGISMAVISKYFPELAGTLEDHIMFRWDSLVPRLEPGFLTALAEFKQDPQEGPIFFCGDWHNSPNFAGAMTSGQEAAQRLISYGNN